VQAWEAEAEVRCAHAAECGACPLMPRGYESQRRAKAERVAEATARFGLPVVSAIASVDRPSSIEAYRRRAKLVVSRGADGVSAIGLFRRNDNQLVVDIPDCKVLSPAIAAFVRELRALVTTPPPELAPLLVARSEDGAGVLSGIDVRELRSVVVGDDAADSGGVLLTLSLVAERAAPVEVLREAARALRQRFPVVHGVAAQLRFSGRPAAQTSETVTLSGASELRDTIDDGAATPTYQLVSHASFLHVHRGQAAALYRMLVEQVGRAVGATPGRVLDLYGGTGAIALTLAGAGHSVTLVESNPGAVSLATRAAQAQRLAVEVVSGEVASVTKALAAAGVAFDVVVANPPRRGLSPAAREAMAALGARRIVYVACELDNLSRDLEHLARLGYRVRSLLPLDMLPLTEEVEVVALLERAPIPAPEVLHVDASLVALAKPAHEPIVLQAEYPSSLVERARDEIDGGDWVPVLSVDPGESGVCLFARDARQAGRFRESLERTGRIVYLAAARGVTPTKGAIARELRDDDEAAMARTRYRRLALGGGHSVLRVVPERPVPHQVRRHLAAIGHPVLGDMRYGHAPTNRYFEEKHGLDRSFVHLVRVEFEHPDSGERLLVEAPLASDLRAALVRASDDSVLQFLEQKQALGVAGSRVVPRDDEPASERVPSSTREPGPESIAAAYRQGPVSIRGRTPLERDDAPRTIRGELVGGDDPEDL